MSTPAQPNIKAFDPLKYGFKSLVSLWPIALAYVGLTLLNSLPVYLGLGAIPILAPFVLLFFTLFRKSLYVGLIETALHWYDTGEASWKTLVSTSYRIIFAIISIEVLAILGLIIPFALVGLAFTSASPAVFLAVCFLLLCALIYLLLRYWLVFYYMIDTKSSFRYSLEKTAGATGRTKFVRILLTFILLIPVAALFPIGDWVYTFAMVYVYRKLFPRQESAAYQSVSDSTLLKDTDTPISAE